MLIRCVSVLTHHSTAKTQSMQRRPSQVWNFVFFFPTIWRDGKKTAVLDTGDNTPSVLAIRTRTLPAALQASARIKKLVTTAGKVSYRTATTPATVHFARFTAQDYIKYVQSPMQDDLIPNDFTSRPFQPRYDRSRRVPDTLPFQHDARVKKLKRQETNIVR